MTNPILDVIGFTDDLTMPRSLRPDYPGYWRAQEKADKKGVCFYRIFRVYDQDVEYVERIEKERWFDRWAGMVSPLYTEE